jgi:hypothetical protein
MFRHSVSIRFDRLADAGRNRPLLVMIETADAAEHEDIMFTEINPTPDRRRQTVQTSRQSQRPESMSGSGYLKFRNDRGVPEIRIGVREFKCTCSAAIWIGSRIASPGNVPETSSVASPSVLPLPH